MDYHRYSESWNKIFEIGLREDVIELDFTSEALFKVTGHRAVRAKLVARKPLIWAGSGAVAAVKNISMSRGISLDIYDQTLDGVLVEENAVIAEFVSHPAWILSFERTLINIASYFSGIATQTNRFVRQVKSKNLILPPRVTLTRKTLPGFRSLAIYSVVQGGGYPHRVNLASGVLIKENHIYSFGSLEAAVKSAKSVAPHGLKIEVEVKNKKEIEVALEVGVDGILLDNFSPGLVAEAIKQIKEYKNKDSSSKRPDPFIEVSGGITEENIADYAIEGVDVISVGSITHSVKSSNLTLLFDPD